MSKTNRRRNRRQYHYQDPPPGKPLVTPTGAMLQQIIGPVGIALPPDEIYKHRLHRQAPAQEVWGDQTVTYIPERAEFKEGEGCFVYWRGVPYPSKTFAPAEAINAINPVKRNLMGLFRVIASKETRWPLLGLLVMGRKTRANLFTTVCEHFNSGATSTLLPFYLKDGYYCSFVKELMKGITVILMGLGVREDVARQFAENIGCCFEYDNAYRFRGQDLAGEVHKAALLKNFPHEFERLVKILESRENAPNFGGLSERLRKAFYLIKIGWYVPSVRGIIKKGIEAIDFNKCAMDVADEYHTYLYGDYNAKGRTLDQRLGILTKLHGEDMTLWPTRMVIVAPGHKIPNI